MAHVEPLDRDADIERPVDPRRVRQPRSHLVLAFVAVVVAIVAAILLWRSANPPAPAPRVEPAVPPAASVAPAANAPHYPIEAAEPAAAVDATPLPAVPDSDPSMVNVMTSLFMGAPIESIFHTDQIVPRFVATIDNLPRQTVAQSKMSVKPVGGTLETTQTDGHILLRADNAERYDTYVRAMEHADTAKLVSTYVRYYPLFQKAYEDLGYPHGYFNDRLVEVIDHLLATPDVPAPIALAQPRVLYEFADPALEQRSAGQKILMRMGPVNESRVKAKLRAIRNGITGQAMPR